MECRGDGIIIIPSVYIIFIIFLNLNKSLSNITTEKRENNSNIYGGGERESENVTSLCLMRSHDHRLQTKICSYI